jgi:hypothetical protein
MVQSIGVTPAACQDFYLETPPTIPYHVHMSLDFSPLAGLQRADIYFVRHGESEGNTRAVVQGRLSPGRGER